VPYNDPDPSDPMTLHGVVVETTDDLAMRDMAECFIDEYARLGFDANRILHLFSTRGYAGPHLALQVLGEGRIRDMVNLVLARWGGRRDGGAARTREGQSINLTVLNG
jgi:hypothetical protein